MSAVESEFRLLVCGSRGLTLPGDRACIFSTLDLILDSLAAEGCGAFHIIEGGARGADAAAGDYARTNELGLTTVRAEWDRYGKSAGYRRNEAMLRLRPSLVLAFTDRPLPESRGTANMVSLARSAGVHTNVYVLRGAALHVPYQNDLLPPF